MVSFFKTLTNSVIAVSCDHKLSQEEIEKLCWLFGSAKEIKQDVISGKFVGPRKEMITPWSTNAVEITQNTGNS